MLDDFVGLLDRESNHHMSNKSLLDAFRPSQLKDETEDDYAFSPSTRAPMSKKESEVRLDEYMESERIQKSVREEQQCNNFLATQVLRKCFQDSL